MANVDGEGRQWTEEDARRSLAACARSGLSVRAFALRDGLRPKRLYWWMKRLGFETIADAGAAAAPRKSRRARRSTESAPRLVPVVVKNATASAKTPIVIRHGEMTTMELESSAMVSPKWVAAVMIELERAACS